jgi:long-chain acyl-CoA synthetase
MTTTSWIKGPSAPAGDTALPNPVESFLEDAVIRWPDKVAIDFYDRLFTFRELHEIAARVATGLQMLGVSPGVRVGLHLPNTPHYVICFFGVLLAGGTVVNLSPLAGPAELGRQLRDCGVKVAVTLDAPQIHGRIKPLAGHGGLATLIVCSIDDFGTTVPVLGFGGPRGSTLCACEFSFGRLIANDGCFERHPRGDLRDEVAVLQFTGGTTGEPKAAMLTHANFAAAVGAYGVSGWEFGRPGGSTRKLLVVLPVFHIVGLTCSVLQSVATGAELVLHLRFDADRALQDIAGKGINIFSGVPTMYAMLVHHPNASALSSLRYCFSSGAPFPENVLERFTELTGVTPRSGYGLTETTTAGASHPEDREARPGTVGLPTPFTCIEIVDVETGTTLLAAGEPGEVCIAGPQVMKGYWNRPEATAAAIRSGRFHTGDIGFLDRDGYLVLLDRKKDVILSGGFNVFPRIVEEAIRRHDAVADVAVMGMSHAILGQAVKAFVVAKSGATPPSLSELRLFLRDRLASYESPVEMEVCESLPRTDLGKMSKKALGTAIRDAS